MAPLPKKKREMLRTELTSCEHLGNLALTIMFQWVKLHFHIYIPNEITTIYVWKWVNHCSGPVGTVLDTKKTKGHHIT